MPAKPAQYVPLPFVGEPYRDSGYGVRLADLMRQRGDREAALHLQRGDAAANMWLQAGNVVGNAVAGWQRNVEENRRLALEDAERRRRDEIAGLQFEAGKLELDRAKRRDRGESVARSLLPLARRGDGLTTYDRDLLAREFEAAGVADQLPSVFQALDEQEASHLKALEARRDAVAGDAFRVLSSGADEDTFSGLIEYWRANDALPARELEAMEKFGADPAQRERALLAAVQSSPRFAQQVAKLQEANAPKLQAFKPGDVVIDERNPQAGPLFSVPTEDKAPTNIEDAILRAMQAGDQTEVDRLVGVKERIARAGRAPDVDRRAPVAVIGPDGRPVYVRPDDAVGKSPASTKEQVSTADIPPAYRNALDRAILNVPAAKRPNIMQLASRLAADGNLEELADTIRAAAIETENVDTKNQVTGRMATMASLADTRAILEELEAKGVPTNWFTGTVEDLVRKLGTTQNPEYVALANRLNGTLINYRRAATGAAFGEREGADYAKMFPNYRNTLPVNLALIDGLEREMRTYDETYWTHKLGRSGAELIGMIPGAKKGDGAAPAGDGWQVVDGIRIRVKP